ncbi:MAG: hypothetical protein LWX52_05430 [Deltaproteobacteria bacterium]|jgi:TolA-binding protein|nr:hypothetical protein [Deltaproteobacteria bacterium]
MKEMLLCFVVAVLLGSTAFFGCSNDKEGKSEKGAIEKLTDKTAKEVVRIIRTPIDNARSVKNQQENRFRNMEETLGTGTK